MSELKPCPFCGGHAFIKKDEPICIAGHYIETVTIYCHNYECDTEITYDTKDQAINKWNNRPHENKIKADAVREWADQAGPNNESQDGMVNSAYDHADKLERGDLFDRMQTEIDGSNSNIVSGRW